MKSDGRKTTGTLQPTQEMQFRHVQLQGIFCWCVARDLPMCDAMAIDMCMPGIVGMAAAEEWPHPDIPEEDANTGGAPLSTTVAATIAAIRRRMRSNVFIT